jgi:hypothetical protein
MSRYLGILLVPLRLASILVSGLASSLASLLTTTAIGALLSIPWATLRLGKFVLLPLLRLPFRAFRLFRSKPHAPQAQAEAQTETQAEAQTETEAFDHPNGSPPARTVSALPPARGPCMLPPPPEPSPLLRYTSLKSHTEMYRTSPRLPPRLPSPPGTGRDSSASSGSSSPYLRSRPSPSSSPSSRPSSTRS